MIHGRYAKFKNEENFFSDWILDNIWLVDAQRNYLAYKNNPISCKTFVLIRTFEGAGILILKDKKEFILKRNTLFLTESAQVAKYYCDKEIWEFVWIEFYTTNKLPILINQVLDINAISNEKLLFEKILEQLSLPSSRANLLGKFQIFLWLLEILETNDSEKYRDQSIMKAIKIMNMNLENPLTINMLAKKINLSTRSFQRRFKTETGETPKCYYEKIRMQYIYAILRKQQYSIEGLAYKMGFSSPYHLSSRFKKHFGYPPSAILKNIDQ